MSKRDRDNILTISPTIGEKITNKYKDGDSVHIANRKYSNREYKSNNSLNRSDVNQPKESSNAKIQLKNLNFLLRPNSVLKNASSPNSFIVNNQLEMEPEYPLPSMRGNMDERLMPRPLRHSLSNSKLRGIHKPARAYS
jgi:hypothetical protein